jgi:hypothetical protein
MTSPGPSLQLVSIHEKSRRVQLRRGSKILTVVRAPVEASCSGEKLQRELVGHNQIAKQKLSK